MEGLILLATPVVAGGSAPPDASVHMLLPPCCVATSLYPSGLPVQQGGVLSRQRHGQGQPFRGVPPGQRYLQAHKEPSVSEALHPPPPRASSSRKLKTEFLNSQGVLEEPEHPSPSPSFHTLSFTHMQAHSGRNKPPLTHAHAHMHADTSTHTLSRQTDTDACWDMHARPHTCFPSILTWLESWLPPGEERKSKEERAIRVRLLPRCLSSGTILRMAIVEAEPAQTGSG